MKNLIGDFQLTIECLRCYKPREIERACLVYINTLMLQDILAEPAWMGRMTAEDFRALSPLVYTHVNPYGTFELDMDARLPLAA